MNSPERFSLANAVPTVSRFRYPLLGLAALAVLVAGATGWLQTVPALTPADALYRAFALFTISMPDVDAELSPTLQAARWGAIAVAGLSLLSVVRDAFRDVQLQRRVHEAKRARRHVVVRGDGLEAFQVAMSFSEANPRVRVVLIGAVPVARLPALRSGRVVCVSGVNDRDFTEILRDAHRVVVVGPSDTEALAEATRIGRLDELGAQLTVFFDDRDLAAQWNRTRSGRAVSRPARVAMEVLRETEPIRDDSLVPPAVVFGDSNVAVEIVRRIITGWQEPGERIEVHWVSSAPSQLTAVSVGLESRADIRFHQMAPHPELASHVLREISAGFHHMDLQGKVTLAGPRVYVAYEADAVTVTVASALAEQTPDAVVVGVVTDSGPWDTAVDGRADSRPALRSVSRLLTSCQAIQQDAVDHLTAEILADARRWPSGVVSIVGEGGREEEIARVIAAHAKSTLAAVGVELDSRVWPARLAPFLGPEDLVGVAAQIARLARWNGRADDAWLLEFASRFPILVARAGHTPDWVPGRESLVSAEELATLARAAHRLYLETAAATGGASGSANADRDWDNLAPLERRSNLAQVADIPLKLALCGLSWRRNENPTLIAFSVDELELLSEQEHRRWRHFQYRNGRRGRTWDVPYGDLDESLKEFDRDVVRAIPAALRSIGVEVYRIDERHA